MLTTSRGAHDLGHIAHGRHDRGLLDDHRHEPVHTVHAEVQAEPDGQPEDTDAVLDHLVGAVEAQAPAVQ
jgi:hypothetical protein